MGLEPRPGRSRRASSKNDSHPGFRASAFQRGQGTVALPRVSQGELPFRRGRRGVGGRRHRGPRACAHGSPVCRLEAVQYFVGESVAASNLEYRSRPVEILTLQLGGAAFYDAGVVRDGVKTFDVHQSAGFGMRALFPQLDRVVFRVDEGFPLAEGGLPEGVASVSFFAMLELADRKGSTATNQARPTRGRQTSRPRALLRRRSHAGRSAFVRRPPP